MASSSAPQTAPPPAHARVHSAPWVIPPPRPLPPSMPPQFAEQLVATLKRHQSLTLQDGPSRVFTKKLTVSSELRKSPSSSTTSLITPNKGNTGQAASLPDQRLPPNLRPLPPTPGTSSFRSGPSNNTATMSKKISNSKTAINQQPWYHSVDRRRGEEIVCNREDGTFLIRPSTQNQNPYTLTIWFGNRVYNIAIRFRSDQKFALGSEKPNEQSFWSLEDMVAYYQTEQLVLYSGGERTGQTSLKSFP